MIEILLIVIIIILLNIDHNIKVAHDKLIELVEKIGRIIENNDRNK